MENNFFIDCYTAIIENSVTKKLDLIQHIAKQWRANEYSDLFSDDLPRISIAVAGHPDKPELVSALDVPKRGIGTPSGHAGLIHSLAHIEFNAINLALDACYRFKNMPKQYYADWLQVAQDEAYHFSMLCEHLHTLNFEYGSFVAHNGLWEMAHRTELDVLARMGLVPRVLEARGIDAVPAIMDKLTKIKDTAGVEILKIIHHDEIKHVSYGDYWFKSICQERGLEPVETFFDLMKKYNAPKIRGAFNRDDRLIAGFSEEELNKLISL